MLSVSLADTPIDSCTTIFSPGTYYLTNDILNSAASRCIEITSSNVIFDGAGFTIDGIDSSSTHGVYVRGSSTLSNVTVKNLKATDWYYGIYYYWADEGRIENNILVSNAIGIRTYRLDNGVLKGNSVYNGTSEGIYLLSSAYNNLTDNTADNNGGVGITLYATSYTSSNNLLINNTVTNNNGNGIYTYFLADSNVMRGNVINNNELSGITLGLNTDNNVLTGNTVKNNGLSGITLASTSLNNEITNNIIQENQQFDLSIGASGITGCQHIIDNNTGSGNNPIVYANSAINIKDKHISELILCNADHSSIENVTITGSAIYQNNGVFLGYTDYSNITDMNSSNNLYGISLWASSNNTLTDSIVKNNGQYGIYLESNSDSNILTGNQVDNNWKDGIYLYQSDYNVLDNNKANNNLDHGIDLYYSDYNVLNNNKADNNLDRGIYLYHSSDSKLTNNTADNSSASGIYLASSDRNVLTNNTASYNPGYGIGIYVSSWNNLTGNIVINNGRGINVEALIPIYNGRSNILTGNNASNNNNDGIRLGSGSNNTIVIGNTINNNRGSGINIGSPYNEIINNTIQENHEFDILGLGSCTHKVINNMGSGNKPIGYYSSSTNITDKQFSELILCNADHSNIENVTVAGSSIYQNNGVMIYSTDNSNITNLNSSNNRYGIYISSSSNNTLAESTANNNIEAGIQLIAGSNNNILNNKASNNKKNGIHLKESSNNHLSYNTVENNSDYGGIYLESSSDSNVLTGNTANNNQLHGIEVSQSSSNNFTNNTANHNVRGIGLFSSENVLIGNTANNNSDDGIRLVYSNRNLLIENVANHNLGNGIELRGAFEDMNCPIEYPYYDTFYNTMTKNTVNYNQGNGIQLIGSVYNVLTDNTIISNLGDGIRLVPVTCIDSPNIGHYYSHLNNITNNLILGNTAGIAIFNSGSNRIYNNYFDNMINAIDNANNYWNTAKQSGLNIIGGSYLGGNYWSDYNGADTDGDGLGDTLLPYSSGGNIVNGGDFLPLVGGVIETFEIPLIEGWNLVSVPLVLVDPILPAPFESIEGSYSHGFAYIDGIWYDYYAGDPPGEERIEPTIGFWINMTNDDVLEVEGYEVIEPEIELVSGWNLLGYPFMQEMSSSEAAYELNATMIYSYNGSWLGYVPNRTFNSLEVLKPGYGYWVKSS